MQVGAFERYIPLISNLTFNKMDEARCGKMRVLMLRYMLRFSL